MAKVKVEALSLRRVLSHLSVPAPASDRKLRRLDSGGSHCSAYGGVEVNYLIYFAKYEERQHVDFAALGKAGWVRVKKASQFDHNLLDMVQHRESGLKVAFLNGNEQGAGFCFDFCKMMFELRPKRVIMCGICAGHSKHQIGKVLVGTHSLLMSGKMREWDLNQLKLDGTVVSMEMPKTHLRSLHDESRYEIGTFLQSPFVLSFGLEYLTARLKGTSRKLIGFDMESWYFFDVQRRLHQKVIFPVVKGVADAGKDKCDMYHSEAVNKSVFAAMKIFESFYRTEAAPSVKRGANLTVASQESEPDPLEPRPRPRTSSSSSSSPGGSKRRKRRRSRAAASRISMKELATIICVEDDRKLLERALRVPTYKELRVEAYATLRNLLSPPTVAVLDARFDGSFEDIYNTTSGKDCLRTKKKTPSAHPRTAQGSGC